MIEEQLDSIVREYDQNMQASGLSLETYLQYVGQDMNTFRMQMRPMAERRARVEILLEKVAEAEGIEVTEQDIAEEYEKAADNYQVDIEMVKSAVPESAIVGDIKARKAAQIIFESGIATDPVAEEAPAEEKPAEEKPKKTTRKKKAEKPAEEKPEEAEEPKAE